MEFKSKISRNRFEIPQKFCKNFTSFSTGDVILAKINDKFLIGTINVSNNKRIRLRIPLQFFHKGLLSVNTVEILKHVTDNRKLDYHKATINLKNKKLVDLYKILPLNDNFGGTIKILKFKGELFIFKRSIIKITPINQFVDYYRFLEILGLYQGEGLRKLKNYGKIQFANTKIEIINKFLNLFNELGIKNEDWKAFIVLTGKISKDREKKALQFWSTKIKIPKKNFRKFGYTKTSGELCSKHGCLAVVLDRTSLAHCLIGILKNVEEILTNKKSTWSFINGLLEADGCMSTKGKNLSEIKIAYDSLEEALFYKRIIETRLKIKTKINPKKREVSLLKTYKKDKWQTWYKLVKWNIFKDHKERREKLILGFLIHKKTKWIIKYLSQIHENQKTVELLHINASRSGLRRAMMTLEKHHFLQINKRKNYYIYNLTREGKDFLGLHKKLIRLTNIS